MPPLRLQPKSSCFLNQGLLYCHCPSVYHFVYHGMHPARMPSNVGCFKKSTTGRQRSVFHSGGTCVGVIQNDMVAQITIRRSHSMVPGVSRSHLGRPSKQKHQHVPLSFTSSRLVRVAPSLIKHNGYGRTNGPL